MERIFITGHSGLVGREVIKQLNETKNKTYLFKSSKLDLRNEIEDKKILDQIKNCKIVIHCASIAHKTDKDPYVENIKIMKNLLRACTNNQRFIFLSTIDLNYYHLIKHLKNPQNFLFRYIKSKYECEQLLRKFGFSSYLIARLAPFCSEDSDYDLQKRVFFPGQKFLKMRMIPEVTYFISNKKSVSEIINKSLFFKNKSKSTEEFGFFISQKEILKNYSGFSLPIFWKPILYCLNNVLVKKIEIFLLVKIFSLKLFGHK